MHEHTNKDTAPSGPEHVAIIMDGNGRWAKSRGLPRNEGHRRGLDNVRKIVRCAGDSGIKYLTLYAFSVENWQRPPDEVKALMGLLEYFLKNELKNIIKNRIRLMVIGQPEQLPKSVRKVLDQALRESAHFTERALVVALNYGSRNEVINAVRAYAKAAQTGDENPEDLDWPRFARYLYTADIPDPDLIIRTSGESRLSNFLLLQSAYSEMYFTPTLWPDFGPEEFQTALESFRSRERRFGKTGEQVQQTDKEPVLNR